MKKNTFLGGALVSTIALIMVKIIGVIYVIPFNAMIGSKGGALYGYGYNIYALFLSISSAGFPFAVSKLTSEFIALENKKMVTHVYNISKTIIFALSAIIFISLFSLATPIAKLIAVSGTGGNTVEDIAYILRLVSFAILIVPFLSVTRGFLQGHKIISPGSFSQVIEQLVRVIVILVGCYLALNIFNLGLTNAVGISVFAAFVGGIVALIYLQVKLHKSNLLEKKIKSCSKEDRTKIIKKLCFYAVPYVVISAVSNLYEITDMVIVQRVMSDILHIDAVTTESVSSIFTIWGGKFNGIILAGIIGLNTSLTPNLVTSYTKNDLKDVSNKINKSLEFILLLAVPLTLFISKFSGPLWTMFYGKSRIGTVVYAYFVFYALFGGAFTVLVNILQSLSKYKEVMFSITLGLFFNLIFDAPFMLLFHKLGIEPANGAVMCGLVGYTISSAYAIIILKKRYGIEFKSVLNRFLKLIPNWIIFMIVLFIVSKIAPMTLTGKMIQVPILSISGLICFIIYFIACYYTGAFKGLLPENFNIKNYVKSRKKTG